MLIDGNVKQRVRVGVMPCGLRLRDLLLDLENEHVLLEINIGRGHGVVIS